MKTIKIIGIFILVIVFFGGIIYLIGLNSEPSEELLTPGEVKQYRERIDKKWEGAVWNDSIFENVRGYLGRHRSELKGSYYTLMDYNSETAIQHLEGALMGENGEFHKRNCSTVKVEEYYAGVIYLQTNDAEHVDNDRRIAKIKNTYSLYNEVEKFCNRNFKPTPSFDLNHPGFWEPQFSTHRNNVMATMNGYKNDNCYGEIRNITRFQEVFNSVSSKLDEAELEYMDNIINLVRKAIVSDSTVCDSLNSISRHFRNDFGEIMNRKREAQNKYNTISELSCSNY